MFSALKHFQCFRTSLKFLSTRSCRRQIRHKEAFPAVFYYKTINKSALFSRVLKRIGDLRSFVSCRMKGTHESTLDKDSSVPSMRHNLEIKICDQKNPFSYSPKNKNALDSRNNAKEFNVTAIVKRYHYENIVRWRGRHG